MKKPNLLKSLVSSTLIVTAILFTSCSDDNDVLQAGEEEETEHVLKVNPNNATNTAERNLEITALPGDLVTVNVEFTGEKTMRRLYMTKNIYSSGLGQEPYEYSLGSKKNDGSIDLNGEDKKTFSYIFQFEAPSNVNDVVQYVLWTTNDKGDFRDISKRNSIADDAYGTVTITAGTGATINGVKSFSAVILAAPLGNGSSETFISIFDGEKYKIAQQTKDITDTYTAAEQATNAEYSALWDFGYFYGATDKASFVSAAEYMNKFRGTDGPIVDITKITGLDASELNTCYFTKSAKTVADFNAISSDSDLDYITRSDSQVVNDLMPDDIIEFIDAYGNKGLIKITAINGTYNAGDNIQFDVKTQINIIPLKG